MKLTVLIDNQTLIDRYFRGEPGVCYWIEADGVRILFDTGYSDLFLENARKLRITPEEADFVVLSHGHNDHSWGLGSLVTALSEHRAEGHGQGTPVLVAHPEVFNPKRVEGLEIGAVLDVGAVSRHFSLQLSAAPMQLTANVHWLGEVPERHGFEARIPIGEQLQASGWVPDLLKDDSALAVTTPEGLVVVTGCSHSGICNIVSHAMEVTGVTRVHAVLGGFHLLNAAPERIQGTVAFLKSVGVEALYAGHCTDFDARRALAAELPQHEIGVGRAVVL